MLSFNPIVRKENFLPYLSKSKVIVSNNNLLDDLY